jgi:hypothetical protein
MFVLATALTLLTACGTSATYQDITGVTIHHQTSGGTSKDVLTGDELAAATQCLYSTRAIDQAEASQDLLATIYLVEVKDRLGDRMFELYTNRNMKGNKGKYYENRCIYKIIQSL